MKIPGMLLSLLFAKKILSATPDAVCVWDEADHQHWSYWEKKFCSLGQAYKEQKTDKNVLIHSLRPQIIGGMNTWRGIHFSEMIVLKMKNLKILKTYIFIFNHLFQRDEEQF